MPSIMESRTLPMGSGMLLTAGVSVSVSALKRTLKISVRRSNRKPCAFRKSLRYITPKTEPVRAATQPTVVMRV